MNQTKPYVTFRVYPGRDNYFFFTCCAFATRADMYKGAKILGATSKDGSYEAITLCSFKTRKDNQHSATFQRQNKWSKPLKGKQKELGRSLGQILFYRKKVGVGVVAHEMTHAAAHYLKMMGLKGGDVKVRNRAFAYLVDSNHDYEEALALSVGWMTRQFFNQY